MLRKVILTKKGEKYYEDISRNFPFMNFLFVVYKLFDPINSFQTELPFLTVPTSLFG